MLRTTPVEVLVLRELRQVTTVLGLDVCLVLGMLLLNAHHPERAHTDCGYVRVMPESAL